MDAKFFITIIGVIYAFLKILSRWLPLQENPDENEMVNNGEVEDNGMNLKYVEEKFRYIASPIFIPRIEPVDKWKKKVNDWKCKNIEKYINEFMDGDVHTEKNMDNGVTAERSIDQDQIIVYGKLATIKYKEIDGKLEIIPIYDKSLVTKPNSRVRIVDGETVHRFPGGEDLNIIEGICKMSLEYFLGFPFNKVSRHKDIVNPLTKRHLELDIYNPDIVLHQGDKIYVGLGLEYQGPTHYYFPNRFHKTKEVFEMAAQRDVFKKGRCEELHIKLIEVPCEIKNNNVPRYIFNLLEKEGYTFNPPKESQGKI